MPVNSCYNKRKNFSDNEQQIGHTPSTFTKIVPDVKSSKNIGLKWRRIIRLSGAPRYLGPTLYEVFTGHWFIGLKYSKNCGSCLRSFRKHFLCTKTFCSEALKDPVSWNSPPEAVHVYGDTQVGTRVIWTRVNYRKKRL